MVLSENDKEWVKLIARELAFRVNKEVIQEHIKSCPYGKTLAVSKAFIIGVAAGISLVSGGVGFALAELLRG